MKGKLNTAPVYDATYEEVMGRYGAAFTALRTGTKDEVRAAKKVLPKYGYSVDGRRVIKGVERRLMHELLSELDVVPKDNLLGLLQAAGHLAWIVGIGNEERHDPVIWKSVQTYAVHADGHIREAARRIAEGLNVRSLNEKNDASVRERHMALLHEYATFAAPWREACGIRERDAHYADEVAQMGPSVFRTLSKVWEELVTRNIDSTWLTPEEMTRLGMPIMYPHTGREDAPIEFIPAEVMKDMLWRENRESAEDSRSALDRVASGAYARYVRATERHRIAYRDAAASASMARLSGPWDGAEQMFSEYVAKPIEHLLAQGGELHIETYNDLVRALQGLANTYVCTNTHGEPYTGLLVAAACQRDAYGREVPQKWSEWAAAVADAHERLDWAEAEWKKSAHEAREDLEKFYKSYATSEADFAEHIREQKEREEREVGVAGECIEIAHHLADWVAQIEPWVYTRVGGHKVAALCLYHISQHQDRPQGIDAVFAKLGMHEAETLHEDDLRHWCLNQLHSKFLAKVGGWKVFVPSSGYSIRDTVAVLREPSLLDITRCRCREEK
jgi:hypothetical protein